MNLNHITQSNENTIFNKYLGILLFILLGILLCYGPFAINKNMLNPTQQGQEFFLFRITTAIAFLLSIILLLKKKTFIQQISVIDFLFLAVIITLILNAMISSHSFFSYNIGETYCFGILYIAFRACHEKYLSFLFISVVLTGICQAIVGNCQLIGIFSSHSGLYKMTGSFFNPAPFAGYLTLILPVALGVYLFRHYLWRSLSYKVIYETVSIVAIVAIIVVIPASDSRASWMAGIGSSVYITLKFYKLPAKKFLSAKKIVISIAVIIILGVGALAIYHLKRNSADGRLLIWKISVPMILDKPVSGWGFNKYKADYMQYQADYFKAKPRSPDEVMLSDNIQYAYNEALHVAIEFGAIGLLVFGALIISLFSTPIDNPHELPYIYLARAGLLSFLIFSFFSYPAEIPPILVLTVFYVSVIARYVKKPFDKASMVHSKYLNLIPVILLMPILIYGWNKTSTYEKGFIGWKKANDYYNEQIYDLSLQEYKTAYPVMRTNGLYLSNYGKILAMTTQYENSIKILDESQAYLTDSFTFISLGDDYNGLGKYDLAEKNYINAASMLPSHFYPKYCLTKLYYRAGKKQKALLMGTQLLDMKVKVESTAIKQMRIEISHLIKGIK